MRPVDPRLLRYAAAARGYLLLAVATGLVSTGLILAQAGLLAHALASAALGTGARALAGTLAVLLAVLAGRALASYGGEIAALRAAATVKSQLRRKLTAHLVRLGPSWLGGQQAGELAALSSSGLDALDPYFARFLPQLVLAVAVPVAVLIRVALADWISALVIAVTLPLIPVFAVLVGLQTRARTERQWQLLARLGGHFLDVVEGLPTLKLFGRADAQADVIREVTDEYRSATMATLRIAFLSALVLELSAALATALVAVEIGLRLLAGHVSYQTALLVLLLTPEAYLPLRAVGAQFHASMAGVTAAGRVCDILDQPLPSSAAVPARLGSAAPVPPDLRHATIWLNAVTLAYPTRQRAALDHVSCSIRPGDRVAVTGPSGAGKSSLLALLLRFTEPTEGRITVSQEAGGRAAVDLAGVERPGRLATADRLGAAAPAPVRRDGGQQHRAGPAGRGGGGYRPGGGRGRGGGVHRRAARRLCGPARRAGPQAVRRAAAADRAGPGVPPGCPAAAAGRAGRAPGPDHRPADHGHDRAADGRPDRAAGHAPARLVGHRPGRSGQPGTQARSRPPGAGLGLPRRRVRTGCAGEHAMTAPKGRAADAAAADWTAGAEAGSEERATKRRGKEADKAPRRRKEAVRPLLRLLRLARPLRGQLVLAVLAGAASTGCAVALLATAGFLLARASLHPNIVAISVAVVAVRGLSVGRGVFRYVERLAGHDAAFRVLADVRVRVYRRLARLAPAGLAEFRSGDLLARLVSDVDATQDLFLRGLAPPLTAFLVGAGAAGLVALILAPAGVLLAAGLLLAGLAVSWLAAGRAQQAARRTAPARGALTARVTDLLAGAADLHAAGAQDAALAAADAADDELTRLARGTAAGAALGSGLSQAVAGLTLWGVLLLGVAAVGGGTLTRVPLAVITLTALAAFEAVTALPAAAIQLGQARASAVRVGAVLDAPDPVAEPAVPRPLPRVALDSAAPDSAALDRAARSGRPPRVSLRGAQVRYQPDGPLAIDGVDLDLAAGRRVALLGPSGSGKSTVAAVLFRFIDLAGGTATLDGAELASYAPADVRTVISGCAQDPHLFNTTIAGNIRLARPGPASPSWTRWPRGSGC